MKIESPSTLIKEIFRTINRDNRETLKYVFEKSDGFALWIIGIAIGGISFFANNIGNVKNAISAGQLKLLLCLLAISVASGILYRVSYLYFYLILNSTYQGMEIAFSERKTMRLKSNLSGNEKFEELIKIVKEDIGDDLDIFAQLYAKSDDNAKLELEKSIVEHYEKSIEFAKSDYALGIDYVADTYSKFTGRNKAKLLERMKNPKSAKYQLTLALTTICYFVYISTFISALFVFVFSVK